MRALFLALLLPSLAGAARADVSTPVCDPPARAGRTELYLYPEGAVPAGADPRQARIDGLKGGAGYVAKHDDAWLENGWLAEDGDALSLVVANQAFEAQPSVVLIIAIPAGTTAEALEAVRISGGEGGTVTIPRAAFGNAAANPFIGRREGHGVYAPMGDAQYAFYHVGAIAGRAQGAAAGGTRTLEVVPVAGDGARLHFDAFDCATGDLNAGRHDMTWEAPGCRITIACPPPATAECADDRGAHVLGEPAFTSTCDAAPELTSTRRAFYDYRFPDASTYAVGYRVATATHEASCETTLTVADTAAARVTCVDGQILSVDDACAAVAAPASAEDACDGTLEVSCVATRFSGVGVHAMTCSATDRTGNSQSCTTSVSLFDTTAPDISCTPDQVRECAGPCATAAVVAADAADNCSPVEISCPGGEGPFCLGATEVTCTGVDDSGNVASCASTVTVRDTTAPVATCDPDLHVRTSATAGAACVARLAPAAGGVDICDPAPRSACAPAGLELRAPGSAASTCTVTDGSGNAADCVQTLTLTDDTAPTIACPPPRTVSADAQCRATVAFDADGADNCPDVGDASCLPATVTFTEPGTKAVDCGVADASGNRAACAATATMVDDTAPTVTCAAPQTIECAGPCATAATVADPEAADNCAVAARGCAPGTGDYCLGTTTNTCHAVDPSRNRTECQTTVTVVDTTAPTPRCAAPASEIAGAGAMAPAPDMVLGADDACQPDALTVVQDPPAGARLPLGDHLVTVTATDPAGNTATCETIFTVRGVLVPAAPYGEVLVYAEAGEQDGHPCLSGPAPLPWPGTETPVTVTACFADDFQTVVSVGFDVEVSLPPAGELRLEGEYDAESGLLCLSQVTDIVFPGTFEPIEVTACLGADGAAIESITFRTRAPIEPVGEVSLSGRYDPGADLLCLSGAVEAAVPGVAAGLTATACLGDGATAIDSITFRTTLATALGQAQALGRYSAATSLVCFDGEFPLRLLGASVNTVAHACANFGGSPSLESVSFTTDLNLPPLGTAQLRGDFGGEGPDCLTGELTGDVDAWLPVPGVTLLGLRAEVCLENGALGPLTVEGSLRIGEGPSALTLSATGTYAGPLDVSLRLGLADGTRWTPFAAIPGLPAELAELGFSTLEGTLALTAAGPSLEVEARVGDGDGEVTLIPGTPGLKLGDLVAKGRLALEGGRPTFAVSLAGSATIPLGFDDLIFTLEGAVEDTVVTFTGTASTREGGLMLQPFREQLGDGAFVIGLGNAQATLIVDVVGGSATGNVNANASVDVLGASAMVGVDMEIELGAAGWGLTVAGMLQRLDVPIGEQTLSLGDYGNVVIVGSTRNLPGYPLDVDGDPENGKEYTLDVVQGLTFVAEADLVFLEPIFPDASAALELRVEGVQAFTVAGRLALPFSLIRPEHHVPSINAAGFQEVEFEGSLSGQTFEVSVGGALFVEPIDRAGNVQPRIPARARLALDSGPSLGGEVFLEGLWKDPLFIPGVAFMNPGLSAKFRIQMVGPVPVPYPSSLGFNGQGFILKSGEWPETIELDGQGNAVNLPANVFTVGATIFYDIAVTKSGICLLGFCVPMPTVVARVDRQNLRFQDFVDLANRFREAGIALASLPGLEALRDTLPEQALQPIEIPFDLNLRRMQLGLSTHNVELFGTDFTAGVRGALDVGVTAFGVTKEMKLEGYLHPEGLTLSGQVSPLTFIPGLEVVGDPFRREAALRGGHVTAPDADAFDAARTLEAWVRAAGPGAVFRKHDGTDGYELTVGAAAPTDCEGGENCPQGFTISARVLRGGAASEVRTAEGVLLPDTRHHVALTIQENDGTATLFVDGVAVATGDTGHPGASAAALEMGAGLTNIDDMRVWTVARTPAEIAGESRVMPFRFRWDERLAARYEVDLDEGATAWNSRLGGPNAAYVAGAAPVTAADDQDLYFKLMLEAQDLAGSGLWFRGGVNLDWDPPLPGASLNYAAEAALGAGEANGSLYVRRLPVIDLVGLGGFRLGGDGPNAVQGDFDDGLYLSADLLKQPAPSVNASARLVFVGPGGQEQQVAAATVLFDCLRQDGCADVTRYTLRTSGDLDLDVPLAGFGDLGIHGHHTFDSDEMAFHVDGRLSAFGQHLVAGDITVGREKATLSADMNVGDVAGVDFGVASSLDVELVYAPARLCGSGATSVLVGGLGSFEGDITTCLGNDPMVRFRGFGSASIAGIPLANVDVEVDSATGAFIRDAFVNVPGLFVGRVQGHYRSPQDFQLTGTSQLNLPALIAMHSTLTLSPQGGHVRVEVNPGCGGCLVRSTLDGAVAVNGGAITYDLQGDAVVQVAGFTLANGRLRIANGSFAVSGDVDVGIGRASVAGSLDTNTGAYALSGDLAGSLFGGQLGVTGTARLDNAGAAANGTLTLFGSSGAFAAAVSPGHFTAQADMRLGIPTAAGTYDIGNGAVRLVHAPGSLTASVSGRFAVPGVSAALDGTLGDGTFEFAGRADLGPGIGSGTLRVTPAGASVDLSMQAPGFPAARFTGNVGADPGAFVVNGAVDVGGLPLSSSSITIDASHATFGSSISLGSFLGVDLGSASLDLDLRYAPFSVCGTGRVEFPLDRSIGCSVNACLSFNGPLPWFTVNSLDCGLGICLGDAMCGENGFCDLIGRCHGKKGNDEPCAGLLVGDHECQSGFCDIWKTFPVPVCADPLPDGVGCLDDGQCASRHCGTRPGTLAKHCYTPRERHLGEECYDENHCGEGQCWGSLFWGSRCMCLENGQCEASATVPDGYVCSLGDWSIGDAGFCVPPRQEGQGCRSTNECAAGLACGGGQCYRPQSRHNWEGCVVSEQCVSGMCWNGQCRCWEHGQCQSDPAFGASGYCDMGTWLLGNQEGRCHAPKSPDGAYCEDGAWCQSGNCQNNRCYTPRSKHNWQECNSNEECAGGLCWNGRCRCYEHSHCEQDAAFGANSYCDKGDWFPWNNEGQCHTPKNPDGSYCEDGNWCASGACAGNQCYSRWSRGMGEACIAGDQCTTGNCSGGRCGCSTHEQCGAGNFCNYGSCEAKRASNDHQRCDDGNWCQSGLCGWSPKWLYNMCYTYADFEAGHWCDMDQNCRSGRCTWKVFVWTCD